MNTVWIVLSAQQVTDRLRELIDNGQLAQANEYAYLLQSFLEKIKTFVAAKGGHLTLALYERTVIQMAINDAQEIPDILSDYQERFKHRLACGIGMTFAEASKAAQRSEATGEIELYTREDFETAKTETPGGMVRDGFDVPANLFDPLTPVPKKPNPADIPKVVPRPSADQELQAENGLLQAVMQQIGAPSPEELQAQQQQQQQPPSDLLEALNGGPVQGHNVPQQAQGQPQKEGGEEKPSEEEVEKEVDEAGDEADKFNQKLGDQLHNIKSQIPQIMALADSNPKAFSQAMNMISKLIAVAKQRNGVKKSQIEECEELSKALNDRLKAQLPVGSRLGAKKKVLVDGKSIWREMKSGQVKDTKGSAISVKSSNSQAEGKTDGQEAS